MTNINTTNTNATNTNAANTSANLLSPLPPQGRGGLK